MFLAQSMTTNMAGDMVEDFISSSTFKLLALFVFAILVLGVCAYVLSINRIQEGRPMRGVRKIEEIHRQTPPDDL
jgi:hypothetical protein